MAYTNNPYCTVSQVYSALDLSATAQANDAAWITGDLMPEAQAAIDTYLGFSFQSDGTVPAPATHLYSGKNTDRLYIVERCLSFSQVLEVVYQVLTDSNGNFISQTTSTTDITADCVLLPENQSPGLYLKRRTGNVFQEGLQNYTVKGVFGRPSIPADITRACIRTVVSWYKMRDTNYSDYIIEGMVRQHYERVLSSDVKEFLDKYKPRIFRA